MLAKVYSALLFHSYPVLGTFSSEYCFLSGLFSTYFIKPIQPKGYAVLVKPSYKLPLFFLLLLYWAFISAVILHGKGQVFSVKLSNPITDVDVFINSSQNYSSVNFSEREKQVTLPHDWFTDGINSEVVWYQARFTAETVAEQPWAVFIPSVTHNAEVYINGVWIGHGSEPRQPVPRHHHQPLFLSFHQACLSQ